MVPLLGDSIVTAAAAAAAAEGPEAQSQQQKQQVGRHPSTCTKQSLPLRESEHPSQSSSILPVRLPRWWMEVTC